MTAACGVGTLAGEPKPGRYPRGGRTPPRPEHERALEAGTTEKGLLQVRMCVEDFERLLSGNCTVRILCRSDGQWYERSVSMKDMLARADLRPHERAVVATCASLFVVGGWREIE